MVTRGQAYGVCLLGGACFCIMLEACKRIIVLCALMQHIQD